MKDIITRLTHHKKKIEGVPIESKFTTKHTTTIDKKFFQTYYAYLTCIIPQGTAREWRVLEVENRYRRKLY
jgi:penicillin-binding protein 2